MTGVMRCMSAPFSCESARLSATAASRLYTEWRTTSSALNFSHCDGGAGRENTVVGNSAARLASAASNSAAHEFTRRDPADPLDHDDATGRVSADWPSLVEPLELRSLRRRRTQSIGDAVVDTFSPVEQVAHVLGRRLQSLRSVRVRSDVRQDHVRIEEGKGLRQLASEMRDARRVLRRERPLHALA
eukprot:6019426-Prymnesium_polylepis.1